jgi:hypothetical protein
LVGRKRLSVEVMLSARRRPRDHGAFCEDFNQQIEASLAQEWMSRTALER